MIKFLLIAIFAAVFSTPTFASSFDAELLAVGKFTGLCGTLRDQRGLLDAIGHPDREAKFFKVYWTKVAETSGYKNIPEMYAECLQTFPLYEELWEKAN